MRILVVEGQREEREHAVGFLSAAGHDVQAATDVRGATALVDDRLPDAVLLDWTASAAADLVRRIRANERGRHVYIVATSRGPAYRDIVQAVNAGADDYVRKPLMRDEVVTRIEAILRIRRWKRESAPPRVEDWSITSLRDLRTWRDAPMTCAGDLGTVLGTSLRATRTGHALEGAIVAVTIGLVNDKFSVSVVVSVDSRTMRYVGDKILRMVEPPREAVVDVARELANTAGGALKRSMLDDAVALTIGLPTEIPLEQIAPSSASGQQEFLLTNADASVRIGIRFSVQESKIARPRVSDLAEGMVLVRDLLTEEGAMLIPAGTRLTRTQVARVTRFLQSGAVVEVTSVQAPQ